MKMKYALCSFVFVIAWQCLLYGQILDKNTDIGSLFGQKGEVCFSFAVNSSKEIAILSPIISIARINGNTVVAYANRTEFAKFLSLGYSAVIVEAEVPGDLRMKDYQEIKAINDWDYYPTYEAYETMMYAFEETYPELCRIVNIGTLPSGRNLLVAKISDQVSQAEGEPQFLYTSSIHGNETTGYILMLRLIDLLLSNYPSDPDLAWMVDNLEIWINPLANPDGTYAGGNSTINGATRYNDNYVDLNRNYPDPEDGPHPDGNAWQPETIAFMDFASEHHFVMSANFHGGAELVNYPWDTWEKRHPDDSWWQYVSYQYVDTVHEYSNNYFYGEGDGVTNGYDWYTISGGRQDYMTYFHLGRECTIEISNSYILPPAQLPVVWEYNYRSLLNYMRQCAFGVAGNVTDSITGNPIRAKIWINGHDDDSSHTYSWLPSGNFHRLLSAGIYQLEFKSPGYFPKTVSGVAVMNQQVSSLSVQMIPGDLVADFHAVDCTIPLGGSVQFYDESYGNVQSWFWTFEGAYPGTSSEQNPQVVYNDPGQYSVTLTVSDGVNSNTLKRDKYVLASTEYVMQTGSYIACEGLFLDPGGQDGNYGNNKNITMTFYPDQAGKKVTADFLSFSVEADPSCAYDWLRIYDGPDASSPLIGEFCGASSPGKLTATNDVGALTFSFHSDGNVTSSGWEAVLSCGVNVNEEILYPDESWVQLFPNPLHDRVYLRFVKPLSGTVQYRMYSVTGNRVFEETEPWAVEKTIRLDSFQPGVYYLEIICDQGRISKKLMVE
ncbi:MAG: M14 family zinc carboxypeptidase [Bacteroidales bacterium]|nr:T9SS type A sorting domain-containing protein [Lentimicrobiaceae bacterium]MDD5695294.1 M14 family zinc carboxypeptidase [Bacteroidales bacterium]